ncbi:MAG TPA: class I SAM-dependent methyltransferase [Gemmatimonadales bacterium]|nr:class I SAM-dependent methyltransferase [Gemmatimonadales bacterium]
MSRPTGDDGAAWAVALFNRSVLKQEKYRRITELLEDPAGRSNLDIGADNGVISYLLRRRGGRWASADLDPRAVESIRQLVGSDVHQLDGSRTPFPDAAFDQVVVVDYLEHIPDDAAFADELARILKPGGSVIINVPHLKPGSLVNRLRHRIGLTDEWHGHLRPGYREEDLRRLLGPPFEIERAITYSGTFSELIDTLLNGVNELRRGRARGTQASRKGTVVTGADLRGRQKEFRLLSAIYPALWATSRLDHLLIGQSGYKLILRARRRSR